MPCGCANSEAPTRVRLPVLRVATREQSRARAVMCHWCSRAARSRGKGATWCKPGRRTVREACTSFAPACPLGKHDPLVRWLGVRWYGVPKPLRVLTRRKLTGPLPGCGCVKRLKDLWEAVRGRGVSPSGLPKPGPAPSLQEAGKPGTDGVQSPRPQPGRAKPTLGRFP